MAKYTREDVKYVIFIEGKGFYTNKRSVPIPYSYEKRVYYNTSRTLDQSVKTYKSEKTAWNTLDRIRGQKDNRGNIMDGRIYKVKSCHSIDFEEGTGICVPKVWEVIE